MKREYITVNKIRYPLEVHFEKRKGIRASIGKKAIYIRIPSFFSRAEKDRQVKKLKSWARETIKLNPERFTQKPAKVYKDGDVLKVGNREYILTIRYKDKKSSSARIINGSIELSLSSRLNPVEIRRHTVTLLSRCLGHERISRLRLKIDALNKKYFNQRIGRISFKNNKSNWGSCSGKGNINISTRLLFAPDDILEYVCIHELAHLIEMNHSKKFWALVEKADPDHEEKRAWLKKNHAICSF